MNLSPGIRKLTLTAHITASVGWLGAVAGFLALAIVGLRTRDTNVARAVYVSMESVGRLVIVPLSLASLVTGLIQSLGTPWGLFRHYWVLVKLIINVLASLLLLVHMRPVSHVAEAAATRALSSGDLRGVRVQLVADAAAAVVALLVATGFSVYKPRGMTPYGRRKRREARTAVSGEIMRAAESSS